MDIHVIGIFKTQSPKDFDDYRAQVGATVDLYGGKILRRGVCEKSFWNELNAAAFDTFVELSFPSLDDAKRWGPIAPNLSTAYSAQAGNAINAFSF